MRTLLIAAGIAAAAAIPAQAQTAGVKASTNRSTASTFTTTTTTNTNSASGSNATNATNGTTSTPVTTSTNSNVADGNAVQVDNVSGNPLGPTTQTDSAFRPGGPFSNDSGNRALGISAGQSSSGTAAGNSSNGIGVDGFPVATNPDGTINPNFNNPNFNPAFVGTTGVAPEGNATMGNNRPTTTIINVPVQPTPTPLFDQAARDGRARDQARRARGDEPRVYGIAPNTDRDLTWQMPNDRIIRY